MSGNRKRYSAGGPDIPDEEVVLPSGRRLTGEVRQEIVDETRAAARKAGRPSLTRPGRRSPQIGVRLSEEDHDRVKRAAEREGISTSEFARRAIAAEIKRVS
jgi:predicted HicB family RNase H-like nuclease